MKDFYSREDELSKLQEIFNELDGPKIVRITAPSGVGKTRLIQEFYSKISHDSDYWKPLVSKTGRKEIEVIPKYEITDSKLEWLFLSTRSTEKAEHKYDFTFDKIRHQFSVHLSQIIKGLKSKDLNKKIAKSAISVLVNFALPGSSNIIEIVNTVKDNLSDSKDVVELLNDIYKKTKNKHLTNENQFYANETKNIIKSTLSVFKELFKADKSFRIIIYFEDFHWVDDFSQVIVTEIIKKAIEKNWKILFIISNWPIEHMRADSFEFNTLNNFSSRINQFDKSLVSTIKLSKLQKNDLTTIVKDRLPKLNNGAISILVNRCKGDLDLLNDFIDEISQTPGWLDSEGKLQVDNSQLNTLPAKAIDMARSRLLSFPDNVRTHLLWSSLQGIEFDFDIINKVLEKHSLNTSYHSSLVDAFDNLKVITLQNDDKLGLTCEFKRAVFYESSKALIERHPLLNNVKLDLAHVLANLLEKPKGISDLSNRIRIIESFLIIFDQINHNSTALLETKIKSLIEISRHKLLIGDYDSVIDICSRLISDNISSNLKNNLYFLLTEAYYYSGNSINEAKTFDSWLIDDIEEDYSFEIQYSKFLRRNSKPKEALQYVRDAMNKVNEPKLKMHTSIEYIKTLWSLGEIVKAYEKLKTIEDDLLKTNDEDLKTAFSHATCLVLHDLDKSSQVLQHAEKCMQSYERSGDIQLLLLSRVNYADALWALGYLKKASEHLEKSCEIALENELPHAIDISKICYANVLSEQNKHNDSIKEYDIGIKLASEIKHDWDAIYGLIYSKLNLLRSGNTINEKDIHILIEKSQKSDYHYLSNLAFSLLCSYYILENKSIELKKSNFKPSLPVGEIFLLSNLILTDSFNQNTVNSFLKILGQIEGIKFYREIILNTIEKIVINKLIPNELLIDFAIRWKNKYSSQIELDETIKLKSCNYKLCEARCCYDGVYLEDKNEEEYIHTIVKKNPLYFEHLPKNYIVDGKWENISGRKTAVKKHTYNSPDFPDHFNQTRCVFSLEDGACSLQKASMELENNAWKYKPLGCRIHPLQTKGSEFSQPSSSTGKDKYDRGVSYPGYTNYTPCGENRVDGSIWIDALKDEINEFNK